MKIQINDCTIRDGGYLFDKNSPSDFINPVLEGLVASGVDIIEIGFLQDAVNGETIVYENSLAARRNIPKPVDSSRYTGFCDNSRYSLENLDDYNGESFDYLRISFAKHEIKESLDFVKGAKLKGYKVFANPMDAPSYSEDERREIIALVNDIKPYAFSIVDTFGTMYIDDLRSIFAQVDGELDKSIRIGLHTHNNLQLSNALAEEMIDLSVKADRDIVVDGSLYGMGRGAGNAATEVIANYINHRYGGNYNMGIMFDTIEKNIIPTLERIKWGYDLEMFICGSEGAHVDNISYLRKNYQCNSKQILEIISELDSTKRKRYGSNYSKTDFSDLEKVCVKYFENKR